MMQVKVTDKANAARDLQVKILNNGYTQLKRLFNI